MSVTSLNLDNKSLRQSFINCNTTQWHSIHFRNEDIIKDNNPSLISYIDGGKNILKCIKPRSTTEIVKLLWGHSRLSKEIKGNKLLKKIGIRTPQILDVSYGFLPSSEYRFLGYYIMENLEHSAYSNAFTLVKSGEISGDKLKSLLNAFRKDIIKMREHRIVFNDLKLNNIFSNNNAEVIWIDTGVSYYNFLKTKRFEKKFNHSIDRLLRIYKDYIPQEDAELFIALKF